MEFRRHDWYIDLFDMQFNWKVSLVSLLPFSCCILQGMAVEEATLKSGFTHCLFGLVIGLGSGYNRSVIRQRYRIKGDKVSDCFTSLLFCLPAAQEYNEVHFREEKMLSIGRKNRKE